MDYFSVETTNADWTAVGWDRDWGVVPTRIVVDLPEGEVNVLAAWDVDNWWLVSAVGVDGEPYELTDSDERIVRNALDSRREREFSEV